MSGNLIDGIANGILYASAKGGTIPTDWNDEYAVGFVRGLSHVAASPPAIQPPAVIMARRATTATLIEVTTCDGCGERIDISGMAFVRASMGREAKTTCGCCGKSLELMLIDDAIVSFVEG